MSRLARPTADTAGEFRRQRMFRRDEVVRLRDSLALLRSSVGSPGSLFYQRLFGLHPRLRTLFAARPEVQAERFIDAVGLLVGNLNQPLLLRPYLHRLGARHRSYGVAAVHYEAVRVAWIGLLREALGDRFDPLLESLWTRAYARIASCMQEGAAKEQAPVQPRHAVGD